MVAFVIFIMLFLFWVLSLIFREQNNKSENTVNGKVQTSNHPSIVLTERQLDLLKEESVKKMLERHAKCFSCNCSACSGYLSDIQQITNNPDRLWSTERVFRFDFRHGNERVVWCSEDVCSFKEVKRNQTYDFYKEDFVKLTRNGKQDILKILAHQTLEYISKLEVYDLTNIQIVDLSNLLNEREMYVEIRLKYLNPNPEPRPKVL